MISLHPHEAQMRLIGGRYDISLARLMPCAWSVEVWGRRSVEFGVSLERTAYAKLPRLRARLKLFLIGAAPSGRADFRADSLVFEPPLVHGHRGLVVQLRGGWATAQLQPPCR